MTKVGEIEYVVKINTKELENLGAKTGKAFGGLSVQASQMQKSVSQSMAGVSNDAKRQGKEALKSFSDNVFKGITGAFSNNLGRIKDNFFDFTGSLGGAVKRLDTLKSASANFKNMGFSAGETAQAMKGLEASIKGLPTPMDEAVKGVGLIASSIGDVKKGQKVFSALNNAVLGFGGSTADVTNATIQMSQAFAAGRIDGQTFLSMMNSGMGPVVNAIGAKFGYTKDQVKDALLSGKISAEQFQDALIELNEKGGGGLASLDQIARDNTKGIGTTFENAKTAVVRALAGILDAIGQDTINSAINGLADLSVEIVNFFKPVFNFVGDHKDDIKNAVESIKNTVRGLLTFVSQHIPEITGILAGIGVAVSVTKITSVFNSIKNGISLVGKAMSASPWLMIIAAVIGALIWLETRFGFVSKAVEALAPFFEQIGSVAGQVFNAMLPIIQQVADFIGGMINVIMPVIGAIVGFVAGAINMILPVVTAVFGFIIGFIQTIINVIAFITPIVATVIGFIVSAFSMAFSVASSIIAAIMAVITPIVGFFGGIFAAAWGVISAVFSVAVGFFQGVWNGIVAVFSVVGGWFKNVFSGAWNGIKWVWNAVTGFFRGIWNGITGIFGGVKDWFSRAFQGAFDAIKNIFNGLSGVLKAPINGAIGIINGIIRGLNKIKVPGTNIGVNIPEIPKLAKGGVVQSPTMALIGEAGDEAVLPLKNNTGWMDVLASKLGGRGGDININVAGVLATSESEKRDFAEMIGAKLKEINDMRFL